MTKLSPWDSIVRTKLVNSYKEFAYDEIACNISMILARKTRIKKVKLKTK